MLDKVRPINTDWRQCRRGEVWFGGLQPPKERSHKYFLEPSWSWQTRILDRACNRLISPKKRNLLGRFSLSLGGHLCSIPRFKSATWSQWYIKERDSWPVKHKRYVVRQDCQKVDYIHQLPYKLNLKEVLLNKKKVFPHRNTLLGLERNLTKNSRVNQPM